MSVDREPGFRVHPVVRVPVSPTLMPTMNASRRHESHEACEPGISSSRDLPQPHGESHEILVGGVIDRSRHVTVFQAWISRFSVSRAEARDTHEVDVTSGTHPGSLTARSGWQSKPLAGPGTKAKGSFDLPRGAEGPRPEAKGMEMCLTPHQLRDVAS